ncbi:hypothetical protein R50072_33350 [Simiduia litorea]|uniref:SIMPL domain-containing protein n=1 Tax=Simiduia litorea TaxID=1435348 RepID=UPI0036F36825
MNKIRLSVLLTLVCFAFTSALQAAPELKGSPEELKGFLHPSSQTLFISDSAEETAYSDQAIVNLLVTTEEKTLGSALEKNAALRNNIRTQLTAQGIAANDIKNSKFSSSPEFGWFGKEPSSYKVVNRMSIKIEQEASLQNIANISDQYKEVVLSGTQFEHSKKTDVSQKVKTLALKKVMEKKAFYESTLGIKLTPLSFDESVSDGLPTEGASQLEEIVVTGVRVKSDSYSSRRQYEPVNPASSFDEIKYTARIKVEFRVN